jgi:hypothetical protein
MKTVKLVGRGKERRGKKESIKEGGKEIWLEMGKERRRNESWWEERKEMGRTVKVLERREQETGNLVGREGRKGWEKDIITGGWIECWLEGGKNGGERDAGWKKGRKIGGKGKESL